VGPGPVWTVAENSPPPPGFDPRTVQSLYWLGYPWFHYRKLRYQ